MTFKNDIIKHGANYSQNLSKILKELKGRAGLVDFCGIKILKQQLGNLKANKAFVVQMGECAETFSQANLEDVNARIKLLNDFCKVLQYNSPYQQKVIKIGRIAGQYAKPRSEEFEEINGKKIPVYQGDIVNSFEIDQKSRVHDAQRILTAYDKAKETIKLMQGEGSDIFTSHEALILQYEEPLTKEIIGNITKTWHKYNSSAHMLWLGERTRFLNSAHIKYLAEIYNPIGIKISEKTDIEELIAIIAKLNPSNESGKIILISRMGANIGKSLPLIVKAIKKEKLEVLWFCDAMHGNTLKLNIGPKKYKVRYIENICQEITDFAKIVCDNQEYWAGIHLESSYLDIYECVSIEDSEEILQNKMQNKYLTFCDPRLNYEQSMQISKHIANLRKL